MNWWDERNSGSVKSTIFIGGCLWILFTNRSPNILMDLIGHKIFRWASDPLYQAPGIVNDIDGGPPVYPANFSVDNKIIELLDASQMLVNSDKGLLTRNIGTKSKPSELMSIVKQTKPEDNPIIRMVSLQNF